MQRMRARCEVGRGLRGLISGLRGLIGGQMYGGMDEQMKVIQSGPNKEYTRATNALLMCQRVDLWCSGEKEVELAVQHLYKLGRLLNERETYFPKYIQEFYPGCDDI